MPRSSLPTSREAFPTFGATLLPHPRRRDTVVVAEFALPTGSFKDRGAAAVVADAASRGIRRVSLDSSGNAGLAVAAAARRAGLDAVVRVGPGISPAKEALIAATGARVEKHPDRAAAVRACAEDGGAYDASHVRNPLFRRGVATLARAWAAEAAIPGRIVLPVGNGSLLLGLWEGLAVMRREGALDRLPRLIAVQAERCAPIARPAAPGDGRTIADGCAILDPPLAPAIVAAVEESGGEAVAVSEEAIDTAWRQAWRDGFPIEPTSALAFAAWAALAPGPPTGVIATGSGLKRAPGAAS
jgi:threonine synthase